MVFRRLRTWLSRRAWDAFSKDCDDGPIARTGVVWCPISDEWARRMRSALESSDPTLLRSDDRAPGYFYEPRPPIIDYLNRTYDYRIVTPTLIGALEQFLVEHEVRISQWIAHPWRVASVRAFILRANPREEGSHLDGWPPALRKAFILPNGATRETGTTWFRLRTGEEIIFDHPGPCLLLFENSVVEHAAVAGTRERPTIEIDIVPARRTCPAPVYAGIDGWYPWFPHTHASLPLRSVQPKVREARS
jgi:hypothetical protein